MLRFSESRRAFGSIYQVRERDEFLERNQDRKAVMAGTSTQPAITSKAQPHMTRCCFIASKGVVMIVVLFSGSLIACVPIQR